MAKLGITGAARRRVAIALMCVALLLLGTGAAFAIGETTGTVVACATATAPAHTVAVDGGNVATIPSAAASNCVTSTYTVPTVTVTVTSSAPAGASVSQSIANGSTLSGQISWTATPSATVSQIVFTIDGGAPWTERTAPYVYNGDGNTLNTATLSSGAHTFKVVATSVDGTTATSTVSATVSNGTTSATRDPFLQPYTQNSIWNLGLGSSAQWSADSDLGTQDLRSGGSWIDASAWSQPFYRGTSADPLLNFHGTDTGWPVPDRQMHIPSSATPAAPAGGDMHLILYDQTQPKHRLDMYYVQKVTGGWQYALGADMNVCGTGYLDQDPGDYAWGNGVIRKWEVDGGVIRHMVRVVLRWGALQPPPTWTTGIAWPMHHSDFNGPTSYHGHIPFGSTIGIPASVNISSLGLSAGGLMLARALQDYGAIIRDSLGETSQGPTFKAEPSLEGTTALAQMRGDLPKIKPLLSILRNQGPASVNGGGTYRGAQLPGLDPAVCG